MAGSRAVATHGNANNIMASTSSVGSSLGSGSTGAGAFSGAMAGLQFGSQLAAGYGQYQMQKMQNEIAKESALAAINLDREILIRRTNEEARAFVQSGMDLQRRAMEAEASANVAAGEAGVAGISVDRIKNNIRRQASTIKTRQKQSFDSRMDAIDDQFTKAAQGMVARMQGLTPPTEPNLLAMAAHSFGPMLADSDVASDFDAWWGEKFA